MEIEILLCCLGIFVILFQYQAFAKKAPKCRYDMETPEMAPQKLKDYTPTAYEVLITFTVQYNHAGDDESIAHSKTYSREYNIAAGSPSKAEDKVLKMANTFAEEELENQCKEKKCDQQ